MTTMIKNRNKQRGKIKLYINIVNNLTEDLETLQSELNHAAYISDEENEIITDSTQAIYAALSNIEELI